MKNPKSGGKGSSSSHKPGPSSAADRKSRWESSAPSSSNRPAPSSSDPKPKPSPKPAPAPASASFSPHDHPIPPHLQPLAAAASPPAPPSYGFHNLDRRTIVLADGSVRSYFALPPDYPMDPPTAPDCFFPPGLPEPRHDRRFPPPGRQFSPDEFREPPPFPRRPGGPGPQQEYWSSLNLDAGPRGGGPPPEGGPSSLKRKYGDEDEFAWHRQHVQQYGNPNVVPLGDRRDVIGHESSLQRREYQDERRMSKQAKMGGEEYQITDFPGVMGRREDGFPPPRGRPEGDMLPPAAPDVDWQALKRAFLKYAKSVNESAQRKNYLEDGKNGPLKCIVCDRASKEFTDVHELVMHAYNTQNADARVDHLGLHKALCVLLGWNFAKAPESSKAYQSLSVDDVDANRDDLILWPPTLIIHNTNTGRRKDGRMEGLGNKDMDTKLKELGFGGGKSKSLYGKEGHTGVTLVKFANTQTGFKEAERVAEYFEKDNHGRKGWGRAQASQSGDDNENPTLIKVDEKTGEKKRILYGYLATASDLEKVDLETRKKAVIKSRKEFDLSE